MKKKNNTTATAKTPRKKKERAPKEREHVRLINRELVATSRTRAPRRTRKANPVMDIQTRALLSIIKAENPPFIYNEVVLSDGSTKLLGHYKIRGYERIKPITDEELDDLERKQHIRS